MTFKSSPSSHALALSIDWTVALFNLLAAALCIAAAAGNIVVYGADTLRIIVLAVLFSLVGAFLVVVELVAIVSQSSLLVLIQRSVPHLNSYIGRSLTYLAMALLASDSRVIQRSKRAPYLWLWANASALAAISFAFVALSVLSLCMHLPKPRSMDTGRSGQHSYTQQNAIGADLEDGVADSTKIHRDEAMSRLISMHSSIGSNGMMEGSSSRQGHGFAVSSIQDRYTAPSSPPSSSRHAHGSKWRQSGTPPNHRLTSWQMAGMGGITTAAHGKGEQDEWYAESTSNLSASSTPRLSLYDKARRLSSASYSPVQKGQALPRYETTSERLGRANNAGAAMPYDSTYDHRRLSSQLAHSSPLMASIDMQRRASAFSDQARSPPLGEVAATHSRRQSHNDLPPLQTTPRRAATIRRRVFIPSLNAAIDLSSGESSGGEEDEEDGEDSDDDRSVYSLPSGVSPEESKDSALGRANGQSSYDTAQSADPSQIGRRMTLREKHSVRGKIQRGIRRAQSTVRK